MVSLLPRASYCACLLVAACGGPKIDDPHDAAAAFAAAASRGDAEAVYATLSVDGKNALTKDDVRRLLADEAAEMKEAARAFGSSDVRAVARAKLRFADGEEASLDWSNGRFGVTAAGTLPGGGATPEAVLGELRRALARRSYPALLRMLSPATRAAVEQDLRTLVIGLEHPETLPIHQTGDAASAVVPGGHHVTMKRDAAGWRVEDFD
jgi:hypothetical protein